MINLLLSAVSALGGLTAETGILSQYALGVMPPVVEAQQGWKQLPEDVSHVDGFIAVWNCDYIGREALLSIDGNEWVLVLVADCSGDTSTTQWMQQNNIIAEISGELALRFDVVCLCPVDGQLIWRE